MWLLNRLAEPSSHAGLAGLAQLGKVFLPAWAPVFDSLTGLFGSVAVVLSEKK